MSIVISNMPNIILRVLKYSLYVLAFISIVLVLILTTRTGKKIGYLYLSDKASRKSKLEVKVLTVNLYDYPHVSTSLLIEDTYTFDIEGEIEDFKRLDLNYTISSSSIGSNYDAIDDVIDIKGDINGPFRNFKITGNGQILDGTIVYEGLKKRRSVDNVNIGISDINSTKFLALLGEKALFEGNSNIHLHFDTIGKLGKKGRLTYDVKDNNYSGMPVELNTQIDILDDNQTFFIHLKTPTATIDIFKGKYNRKAKYGEALYVIEAKELADLKELLNVKAEGPFMSYGKIIYDKKIKLQGSTDSFGGLIDILYEKKKFHFYLNDVPFHNLMSSLTYSPLLDAKMQGDVTYDQREKEMHTDVKLKDVKIIQKDLLKVINENLEYDVNKETFDNSSFKASYKDKVLTSSLTIANEKNYFNFKNTKLDAEAYSIDTHIDFKVDNHQISGKLYARNDGHANHTLDTYLRFDGLVEQNYHLKLTGALSDKWTNMDYSLTSARCPSHICTIVDDVNITGHFYGPYKRLLIRGEGTALDGNISFDGVKTDHTLKNVHVNMKDIHAKKLYTLLGEPTLPHGKATVALNFEFLNKDHKKGTLEYTLRNGTYETLPLSLTSHVTIEDNIYKFTGDINLNESKAKFTKGLHDSDNGTTHAFYTLDIKDLTTLEPLFGHTYNGPFYAMGTIDYKDEFLISGLSKSLGGITEFLYKEDVLYVDFKDTSLKDLLNLFSYPKRLDAKTNGSVNYHYKKDLVLLNTKLNNAKFLQSGLVDDIYKKSGVYLSDEIFNESTLELTYKNDIILGSIKLSHESGHIFLTNVRIDTDKKLVNANFDVSLQKQAFSGKIYGPLDKPKVNLNFQKLIRHEMDKQLDSMVGQGNRQMMESMPMGDMSKDVASGVGGAFVDMFF